LARFSSSADFLAFSAGFLAGGVCCHR
jgi:hypothetical protein